MNSAPDLTSIAKSLKLDLIRALVPLTSSHIGCSLGILDLLTYLYFSELSINPNNPTDPDRDIFILSKGHAAIALYATLAKRGFFSPKLLTQYESDGGTLPGHITFHTEGIELSTGSLGHGLPVGVGFSLSFVNDAKSNKVVVLISDGELNEGSTWEAIMFAGHHKLSNLITIIDKNNFQLSAPTRDVINLDPLSDKIMSFGWEVIEIDGHNFSDMEKAFKSISNNNNKPTMIIANTIKGKGVPLFEGKLESHHTRLTEKQKDSIIKKLTEAI